MAHNTLRSLIVGGSLLLGACGPVRQMPEDINFHHMSLHVATTTMYDGQRAPIDYVERFIVDEDHDGSVDVLQRMGLVDYVSPAFRAKDPQRFAHVHVMTPEMESALNELYRAHRNASLLVGQQMFADGLLK